MNTSSDQLTLADYVETFRRRLKVSMATFGVLFGIAALAAIFLPDVYRSSTEMRIDLEGPNVDLLEPLAMTSYADQYVSSLQQRVLTFDEISTWIDETNVYPELRGEGSRVKLYRKILDNIRIEMVTTEAMDPRSGRPVSLITGFVAAFDAEEPEPAFQIAGRLAAAFLAQDRKIRTERAAVTSSFLLEEIEVKRQEIAKLEARIAAFKQQNAGSLPELMGLNMSVLDRTERDMESVRAEARVLQQDKIFRESQLEEIRLASKSVNRLRQLEDEYLRAISVYGPDHPDVIRIRRQVAALTGGGVASGESGEIARLEAELAEARQRYSDVHPDVIGLRRQLEQARTQGPGNSSGDSNNPRYLQLRAQVNAIDSQLAGLRDRTRTLQEKYDEIQDRIARMPQVEKRYLELTRDLQSAQLAFEDLGSRLTQAKQIESFESGERGARLVNVRNAALPTEPVGPPRLAIVILGSILGVSLAFAAAILTENLDGSVRGRRDIRTIAATVPIAEIPVISSTASILQSRRQARIVLATVFFLVAGGAILLIWSGA